jgi:hypothetical protein
VVGVSLSRSGHEARASQPKEKENVRTTEIVQAKRADEARADAAAAVHLAVEAAVKHGVPRRSLLLSVLVPLGYAPTAVTAEK